MSLLINGMQGLGDNIYQRFVLQSARREIYLVTSWPQLYADLPFVKCVKPNTTLRTQQENIKKIKKWHEPPRGLKPRPWHYVSRPEMDIVSALEIDIQMRATSINGPKIGRQPVVTGDFLLVRPATVRAEWRADARNPKPEYIKNFVDYAKSIGLKTVSIADYKQDAEWPILPEPDCDVKFDRGELDLIDLLALVNAAKYIVGGVGWITPASIAYNKKLAVIFGGWGYSNGPQRIFNSKMDLRNVTQILPDNFCMCKNSKHDCDKTITGIDTHVKRFISS